MKREQSSTRQTPAFVHPCHNCISLTHVNLSASVNTTPQPRPISTALSPTSRRAFLLSIASLLSLPTRTLAQSPPRRTLFDEERELNEKIQREAEEARITALRAGFEAVEKAALQLDDLQKYADEQDWDGIRRFSRYFNNAVEREGMEPLATKLRDKQQRKEALAVCKQVTEALKAVDRAARLQDREQAHIHVAETRDAIARFQLFKP